MIIPEISCGCGFPMRYPILMSIGSGTAGVRGYIRKRDLGNKLVLVADNIAYEVAGRKVEEYLGRRFQVTLCLLEREEGLKPDETALGEVLLAMDRIRILVRSAPVLLQI